MHTHLKQWAANAAAPGEQLGVWCLAQGFHLSRGQFLPEPRLEPTTLGYKSDPLGHDCPLNWTGLLPSGPKSSFQMRASFVFNLETKVLESGGRVGKLIAQVAWSPVLSFHSLWWFGVQCHLLVLVHCVFWKPTSLHPFTKKCWSTSCFLLLISFLVPKAPIVG